MLRRALLGVATAALAASCLVGTAAAAQAGPTISAGPPAATAPSRVQVGPDQCVFGYVCAYLGTNLGIGGTGFFTSDVNWNVGPFAIGNRAHSAINTGDPNDPLPWVYLYSLPGWRDAGGFPGRCLPNSLQDGRGWVDNLGALQPESNKWFRFNGCTP
jgi:hypothetical protein